MKITGVFLIIALCLAITVIPVTAEKENQEIHTGSTVEPGGNSDQDQTDRKDSGDTDMNASLARETVREVKQDAQADDSKLNRTTTHENPELTKTLQEQEQINAMYQNTSQGVPIRAENENQVQLAVRTILALENSTGGIGSQVSVIARDYNNSAILTQQLENRIETRDAFSKFFFGGDQEAAGELAQITIQNRERIQQIQLLINTTTMDPATRTMMTEQLQVLEQEQVRLEQIASEAQQDTGLFGWIGK